MFARGKNGFFSHVRQEFRRKIPKYRRLNEHLEKGLSETMYPDVEKEVKTITADQQTKKQEFSESLDEMCDMDCEESGLSPVSETCQERQTEDTGDEEINFDDILSDWSSETDTSDEEDDLNDVSLTLPSEMDEYEREPISADQQTKKQEFSESLYKMCDIDSEDAGMSPVSETGKDRLSEDSTDEEEDFDDISIDWLSDTDEYERKPITAEQKTKKQESGYKMSDIGDEEPSLSPVSETHQEKQSEDTSDEEADFDDVSLEISSESDEYERELSICDIDSEEPGLSPLSETGKDRLSEDSTDEEEDFDDISIDWLSDTDEYERKPITAEQKNKKQESGYNMSDIGDEDPSLSPVSETQQEKQSEDTSDEEADFDDVSLEISPERDEYEREPSMCDIDGEEPSLSPLSETGKDRLSEDSTDEEEDFDDISIDLLSDTDEYERKPITAEQKTKKQESGYKMSDIGDQDPSLSPVSETHQERQSENTSDEEDDFDDVSLEIPSESDEYKREPISAEQQTKKREFSESLYKMGDIDSEEPGLSPVSETHQERQSEDTSDEEADFDDVSLEIPSETDEYEREPISPEQQTKKQEVFELVYKIDDIGLKENTVTEQDGQKVDALHHMLTEKDREIANLTANMLKRDRELVALQLEKESLEHIFLKTVRKKEKALASCVAKLEVASRREGELTEQLIILRESNAFDMEHQKHQSEALLILEDALAKKDKEIANLVEKHQQGLREQADKFASMRQTNDELKQHTLERVLTEKDREIASLTANNFERDRELVALRQEKESLEQSHLEVVQKKEETLACCVAKLEEASRREGELVEQLRTIKEHNTFHMEREKHQSEALLILEDALAKKDKEIANLMEKHQQELREQANKLTSMRQTNDELKQHTMERILTEKDNEIATLTANKIKSDCEVVALRQEKESLEQSHLEVVREKEKTLARCVAKLEKTSRREGELAEQLRTLQDCNALNMGREKHQSQALFILEDVLAKKDKEIANLMEKHQQELSEQADKLTSMRQTNDELKQHTLERVLTEKDREIASQTAIMVERDRELVALQQEKESLEHTFLKVLRKKEKALARCVVKLEEASRREVELAEQLRTLKEHNKCDVELTKHHSKKLFLEDVLATKEKEIANLMEKHHQEKEDVKKHYVSKLEEASRREEELNERLMRLTERNALDVVRENKSLLILQGELIKKDREIERLVEKHHRELLKRCSNY